MENTTRIDHGHKSKKPEPERFVMYKIDPSALKRFDPRKVVPMSEEDLRFYSKNFPGIPDTE